MKKVIILFGALLLGVQAHAAVALVAHTAITGGAATLTTTAINTTGATLLQICYMAPYGALVQPTDSANNAAGKWINFGSGYGTAACYYILSPTTSSSHTFSVTNNGGYNAALAVYAFSGVASFDTASMVGGPFQPGSITPASNGELLLTVELNWSGSYTSAAVNSGFTITDNTATTYQLAAQAWQVQTTAAAINPTWSGFTDGGYSGRGVAIAAYKPSATTKRKAIVID